MSVESDLRRHRRTLTALAELVDRFPEDRWHRKAPDGGWSAAEVYGHVSVIARNLGFRAIDACLAGEGRIKGPKPLRAAWVLFVGRVPNRRIRVKFPPELVSGAPGRDEARAEMRELARLAEDYARRIPGGDRRQTVKHPFLGWLSAAEWFRLMEMHHRHHLERQLRRLLQGVAAE